MPISRCIIRSLTPSPTPSSISTGTGAAFSTRSFRSRSIATAATCCMPKAAAPHCSCRRAIDRPCPIRRRRSRGAAWRSARRVALIASSSWSHCFLSPTNGYLWPDHAADRLLFDALSHADYDTWRKRSLKDMEQAGQHEMLNWMALMGAMETLHRRPVVQDYAETHVFMSEKCFVSYPA